MHRRELFRATAGCVAAGLMPSVPIHGMFHRQPVASSERFLRDRVCLFMDHLDDHGYDYSTIARHVASLGIAGADLTVRGGGVVAPERVAAELPRAAAAFADEGLAIPMISTNLNRADDPTARPLLAAMQQLGIQYFKLGYYHYEDPATWQTQLQSARQQLVGLAELAAAHGVAAGLHNHAGPTVGGALWDGLELLAGVDPRTIGFYFDPAHATIEGSKVGWRLHLARITGRIKMIALKDFVWVKRDDRWDTRWCPLGEGQVDWPAFFRTLSKLDFTGPVSLHIEYDPGGRTPVERLDNALAAAQRDLAFVRKHLTV